MTVVHPELRRIRLDVAYDGSSFAGWQIQREARTVQAVLSDALQRIQAGCRASVRGAGRTDAGVHARGQVADADVASRLDDEGLLRALRSLLPEDLRPIRVMTVPADFHARHDALAKTYEYTLDRTWARDPFLSRYALHHPHEMDADAVSRALRKLPGRKDWSGFAGAACDQKNTVRDLMEASYEQPAAELGVFRFTADGFLNHMVRNLVGTLLEIARGKLSPDRVDEVLGSCDRRLAGPTAPAHGLCLVRVVYAPGLGGPSATGSLRPRR